MHTKGEWKYNEFTGIIEARLLGENGFVQICEIEPQSPMPMMLANAHLIVSAVNTCAKVNPDNPQAVAESIPDLYEALKEQQDYLTSLRHIAETLDEITKRVLIMHISSIEELRTKALALADGKGG